MSYPVLRVFTVAVLCLCLFANAFPADAPKATAHQNLHSLRLPVSPSLSLHDTVEKAYARSPTIQVLSARVAEADALRRQSESFWASDPSISAHLFTDQGWSGEGFREWETGLELPLWWPGQKVARRKVAEQAGSAATASGDALWLTVAGLVREALWDVAITENRMVIAMREWETARRLEQDVDKRVRLGDLARTDLILTQQETLARESAHVRAAAEHQFTLRRYRILTGLDAIPGDFKETLSGQPQEVAIAAQHPLLAQTQAEVERAMAERDKSRGEKRGNPTLTLGTHHDRGDRKEDYNNSFNVALTVPLGLSSQAAPKLAAAELALAEAQSQRDQTQRQLEIALREAERDLTATREELVAVEQQNRLAQENLALTRKAFALGEIDLFTMLRVQTQAFTAERTLEQKRFELGLNIARVNQALGVIP
jgi:outer membrane protein TolC